MSVQRSKAICVLGMHRSGTSTITRALNLIGAYIGKHEQLMPPKEGNNPEGFWEHMGIVKIHEQILHRLSSNWDTTIPLPDKWWELPEIQPLKDELVNLIHNEFLQYPLWVWKDPRSCLLLPLWKEIFKELNIDVSYVITLRNPLDVAASLEKRDGFSKEKSLGIWTLYTLSSLMYSNDSDRIVIHYDRFLEDWNSTLKDVATVCNIPWPEDDFKLRDEMKKFLKPSLRHSQSNVEKLMEDEKVPSSVLSTYRYCLEAEKTHPVLQSAEFKNNIHKLFNEYVGYTKMISSSFNPTNNIHQSLQIYWNDNGGYSEEKSKIVSVNPDGMLHTYELSLPSSVIGSLRIDPVNFPAFVEIKSIELFKETQKVEKLELLKNCSSDNNFEGLSAGTGVLPLTTKGTFKFLSINEDPQLFINGVTILDKGPVILRLVMKAEEQISSDLTKLLESELNNQKTQLNQYAAELVNKQKQISQQDVELSKMMIELTEIEERLLEQTNELLRIQMKLTEKEEQLLEQTNELSRIQMKLTEKEDQLSHLTNELSSLKFDLQKKGHQLDDLLGSTSWKATAPFRWLGTKARKMKQATKNSLQILLRRKYRLQLIPVNQLQPGSQAGVWQSVGNDPQFLLQGSFPVGWVEISWVSMADSLIPLKIYWDEGAGINESQSLNLGSILPEGNVQSAYVNLSPMAKSLRLDPGEEPGQFMLSDITIVKISRLHVVKKSLKSYLRIHGSSFSSLINLVQKALRIYSNEGIRGLWNRAKCPSKSDILRDQFKDYEQWLKLTKLTNEKRQEILDDIATLPYQPLISVIVPVYNVEERWLRKCIESVRNQLYPKWELCIADDASPKSHVKKVLKEYATKDPRIKVVFREANGHISEASNSALELATGEFVALLDHDDELTPDALYENVILLNRYPDADMIYSDEDKISPDGLRHSPFFKPNWSPDTFLSQMYTCHLGVYRTSLVRSVGGFRKGFEGSQDYDLVLRLTEKTDRIFHIPKILYHWRTIPQSTASSAVSKGYTQDASLRAIEEALVRRKIDGWVEAVKDTPNVYRVHHRPKGVPLISILIPIRDMADVIDICLSSIFQKTTYKNFEVIIIDNGSEQQQTFDTFEKWIEREPERVRVERMEIPFNYSRLNNLAVKLARGELILLLNNDVEVISPDWLEEMAGQAQRSSVGAVGAMLLYPDKTIQHAGVILVGGVAGHSHKHFDAESPGYFYRLRLVTNYSAVTAACLMVRKEVFEQIGGLDEELAVAFNDVDFCLKLSEKGLYNVWLPHVRLYHYESKSRGHEDTPEKQLRFRKEIDLMKERWGDLLLNDPFYNPNLTLDREDFSLGVPVR
ncbi:glycosyltransferase [Effusibacillus dendaii]|uniref:Glycosyltransferase 2-like domain-containing protein n=1 Tax=Effusibacillus dendaii TaxID=2743772 RepID=A0A7I8DCB1_9BACL|nr:glycosyltransferase [Effusibacillus dendaii]BCJ87788.1 hypothetical protein skT53_27730 [Effusibacillus dendaii]